MNRPPIVIRVEKSYAGIFFAVLLGISIYGIATLIEGQSMSIFVKVGGVAAGIFGIALSVFGLFSIFSKRFEYDPKSSPSKDTEPFITITENEIICEYPSQNKREMLLWKKINRIQVLTTDEGPVVCDVFFVLRDSDGGGVILPQDKEETKLVLDKISEFPGFDYKTFINAMGSTENKWFDVWDKK